MAPDVISPEEATRITDLYLEVFGEKELDRANEIMTDDYVNHLRTGTVEGLEAFCDFMRMVYSGMPDVSWQILDTRVDGDRIIYMYEVSGTHHGEIMGMPGTGREIRFAGMEMNRIAGGRIAETWNFSDAASLMRQVGAIPAQPSPPAG